MREWVRSGLVSEWVGEGVSARVGEGSELCVSE